MNRRDVTRTIRDAAADARAKRGRLAALWLTGREWLSVWFARPARITTGRTPKPPRSGEPLIVKLFHDARQAWRSLLATRGVVALAVFTLALGIGVNTAVFSVLDSLLFRSVPYADSERLSTIWTFYGAGKFVIKGGFTPALAARWRQETDLFARLEASQMKSFIYDGQGGADMVAGAVVTPGLFPMLGVGAAAGRLFDQAEGRAGSDRVAIVSDRFWRERLGRDPSAIGRPIVLDSERYVVIGVMPATFRFPTAEHDVWLPFDIAQPPNAGAQFEIIARLQAGLARADAEAKVEARGAEINRVAGGDGRSSARLRPLINGFDERTTRSLAVLAGAVICLLLIVCANVANLTLARALSRSGDLAVRASLGASRADLFRVALVEHALVGLAGGVLAIGIAQAAVTAVAAVLPAEMTETALNAIDLDARAFGWLAALSILTVLVFGIPPAVMASRASVTGTLRRASRSTTTSRAGSRLRGMLVVVEVALCIVLLVGAALMARSLLKLQAIDIGMDVQGLVSMQIALPSNGYADRAVRDAFMQDVVSRARRQAGITRASAGTLPPNEMLMAFGEIELGDRPGEKSKPAMLPAFDTWPGYFQAAGIALVDGREFLDAEMPGAVIVSQGFAAKHWPGRSAVGATFQIGKSPRWTVVGVVSEVRRLSETDDSKVFELYLPHDQIAGVLFRIRIPSSIAEYRTLIVRTARPAQAARDLAAVVHDIDPRAIVSKTTLIAHEFADSIARPRVVFLMMAVFAMCGLVLAAAGLYGVLSYLVSLRQHEIGIRLALGATARDVGRLVMGRGLSLVVVGLVAGLAAALALVRVMRTLLYEVEPTDPVAIVAVVAVMIATAALAAWRPTRRAMRVDPVRLLRES